MRFLYGKQDWKTFERGEENCYLMVNGLGGFSSLSIIGSCSRNDQAVLMACLHSPNHRYNMIHRLEERLTVGKKELMLSSQDFQLHERREEGYRYQNRFTYRDYPQWTYLAEGVEVLRTIGLMHGKNTVGISYEIRNHSQEEARLQVLPQLQFVPKGGRVSRTQEFVLELQAAGLLGEGISGGKVTSLGRSLYFTVNGEVEAFPVRLCESLYYSDDIRDGKVELGRSVTNHAFSCRVPAGETRILTAVYGMDAVLPSMEEILGSLVAYRESWRKTSGFKQEAARTLSAAASQFVSYRASTTRQTILAGFPFFEDWGRDTMIALLGCCLSTKQYEVAEDILRTFMLYCKKGLMPNLFPEGKDAPGYNTVDASLLFIIAVYEYYRRTKDQVFVDSAYPIMEEIIEWYEKGTDFGIRMDADGLIMAGQDYDQVTWMDVRVGDILPTPRHGKPVEINAYWYNALRIMEGFQCSYAKSTRDYGAMADKALESFRAQFWNEKAGCLKDVISRVPAGNSGSLTVDLRADVPGTPVNSTSALMEASPVLSGASAPADEQIRCNQIWAVSLPFSLLPPEQEKQVVDTVFRKLYTPYGLRTLDPEDPEFHPFYGGAQLDRDLAYHQGTVWTFPLGGFYLAYLKVNQYSEEAKAWVREQMQSIEAALWEGCVGQLPEIYDGGNPVSSKGCFAQAWSVGEMLRVYESVEV